MDLQRFVTRFGFKVSRVHHHNPYEFDRGYGINYTPHYKIEPATTIEMEIGQRELESMADYFIHAEKMLDEDHAEHRLRRAHPAVAEAYSKYKMLLELYK